jgi:hypothetical protein
MTRAWIATALLAGSWLLGLGYYQPANLFAWACLVAVAAGLLSGFPVQVPNRITALTALLLSVPAALLLPLPYRAIPLALIAGLALSAPGIPRVWPRRLGQGCLAAAAILLVQGLVMEVYARGTARCHELPALVSQAIGAIPRLLGLDAAVDGSWLVVRAADQTHRIAATWDLLFDPASLCFALGGLTMAGLALATTGATGTSWKTWLRYAVGLLLILPAWAPLRVAMLLGIVLHRALRADVITAPNVADIFVNAWIHLGLLAVPTVLAIWLIDRRRLWPHDCQSGPTEQPSQTSNRRLLTDLLLVGAGVASVAFLVQWDPVGRAQSARIMVVERHSTWEPTTIPYRTSVYGEAGSYNYAAAFEYCGQYFEMSRLLESDTIDDQALSACDVLVIKTPTARYTEDEVTAVVRFVRQGGALLLIGDHTNVFNMNTYLNDISRHFGFTFRNDLLFRVGSPYVQRYRPPRVAHPVVQHVPPMNFAVSCSIDPGDSAGRMVIRNAGLYSLPPAYQESNYHPQAEYRSDMQYGAWCQLWSTTSGRGRVLGFADSTLFSNFCVFQPGKAELLRGMLHWLNHRSVFDRPWVRRLLAIPLACWGLVLIGAGVWRGARRPDTWIPLLAAGLAGWSIAALTVIVVHRTAMPVPAVQRPMRHVVIDRAVSDVPLFTGAFEDDKEGLGYGLLEQWIPRVGNRISRETDQAVFSGDALVVICPTRSVSDAYREQLVRYVQAGGKLLVFDSPDVENSTANSLLWPFGLESNRATATETAGTLVWPGAVEVPQIELSASCSIVGGEPLAQVGNVPTAAQVSYGQGQVTAVGFGSLFNDATMGYHWLPEPAPETLRLYDVLYHLLRRSLPSEPVTEESVTEE